MMKRFLVFSFVFLSLAVPAFVLKDSLALANNLVISNVTIEDRNRSAQTMVVQFDISWDHSWRKNDGRHDAVWVFVKVANEVYYPVSLPTEYVHGILYTAGTNPVDTSPGTNPDTKIVIPSDKIGAFISRQATGSGTFSSRKVRLTVDSGSSGIGNYSMVQVQVFGIEMVYIPEGAFYIGDGDGSQESQYAFHLNGADNSAVQITTTAKSITVDTNSSDDIDTSPIAVTGLAGIAGNTSWPNGYDDFYLMKYEITQGQYVDFLNTLTRVQQGKRVTATVSGDTIANYYVMSDSTTVSTRQGIRAPASGNGTSPTTVVFGVDYNDNATFNQVDDGASIAMTTISFMDFAAYADWAGLRPMTELEFEKACRGQGSANFGEYAWGNTKITQAQGPGTNLGRLDELASSSGEGLINYNGSGTDMSAPFRVGFAATNATKRQSSGAGYYGNMEVSGNQFEMTVSLGDTGGRAFTGTHGDGILTETASYEGNATNTDWPGIDATTARGVTGASGSYLRGGSFLSATNINRLSWRNQTGSASRVTYTGGRCARTAP